MHYSIDCYVAKALMPVYEFTAHSLNEVCNFTVYSITIEFLILVPLKKIFSAKRCFLLDKIHNGQ